MWNLYLHGVKTPGSKHQNIIYVVIFHGLYMLPVVIDSKMFKFTSHLLYQFVYRDKTGLPCDCVICCCSRLEIYVMVQIWIDTLYTIACWTVYILVIVIGCVGRVLHENLRSWNKCFCYKTAAKITWKHVTDTDIQLLRRKNIWSTFPGFMKGIVCVESPLSFLEQTLLKRLSTITDKDSKVANTN